MSSMGDNTKSADVSISVESVDDQSSSIPPPKIATTATEPPLSKKSRGPDLSSIVAMATKPITTIMDIDSTMIYSRTLKTLSRASSTRAQRFPEFTPTDKKTTAGSRDLPQAAEIVISVEVPGGSNLRFVQNAGLDNNYEAQFGRVAKALAKNVMFLRDKDLPDMDLGTCGVYDPKITVEALDELKTKFKAPIPIQEFVDESTSS
ncbi:hypothetical protein ACH5RR_009042 [Cinchona calisaya]|uniref:Uncharacterized protein n=1 Tax=Cinchona calisaya TaxID=153742 RepID=A0ABD3AGP0_9GENT